MSEFQFSTATRVLFGCSVISKLIPTCQEMNLLGKAALILTGSQSSRAQVVIDQLISKNIEYIIANVTQEPTCETADAICRRAREEKQVDFVIAIGGGSVIDTGKAVAMLLTNGGESLDYLEVVGRGQPITKPSLPFIAIPTTSGTGAEVTKNAVLNSIEHKQKASLRSNYMYPNLALVDPMLTVDVPPHVTASTGLDAFTQCLEPYVSCNANPLCDAIAIKGLEHGARALRQVYLNPRDVEARTEMSLCSLFGGMALANAKLGAVHGFAGVLGGLLCDAPHGCLCASLLAATIVVNVRALRQRESNNPTLGKYQNAARVVLARADATAEDLAQWIQETCQLLKIKKLSEYGLKREDVDMVVEKSANASSMKGNSLKLTRDELIEIVNMSF